MSADETQAERYERLLDEHRPGGEVGRYARCACGWQGSNHRIHVAQVLAAQVHATLALAQEPDAMLAAQQEAPDER